MVRLQSLASRLCRALRRGGPIKLGPAGANSGEMNLRVRAPAVGGVEFIVRRAVDRKGAFALIETDHVVRAEVGDRAGRDPEFSHEGYGATALSGRSESGRWRGTEYLGFIRCCNRAGMISR